MAGPWLEVGFGAGVAVMGMLVEHADLIHADQHGAVVVPIALVDEVIRAADTVTRREQALLAELNDPGFSIATLRLKIARALVRQLPCCPFCGPKRL